MTAYVCTGNGDWDNTAIWDVAGYPGDGVGTNDTASVGGYVVTVPAALTIASANAVALTLTGTGPASGFFSHLINNGTLNLTSFTLNGYCGWTTGAGSLLDTNGGNIDFTTYAAGRYIIDNTCTALDRGSITTGGGTIGRSGATADVYALLDWQYVNFDLVGAIQLCYQANNGTTQLEHCEVQDCVFARQSGRITFGGYRQANLNLIFARNDIRDWTTGGDILYLRNEQASGLAGIIDTSSNTFSRSTAGTIRTNGFDFDFDGCVLNDVPITKIIDHPVTVLNALMLIKAVAGDTGSGLDDVMQDSYIVMTGSNPHTLNGIYKTVDGGVIEATNSVGDGGDHFIVTNNNAVLTGMLIIDKTGGALLNALGSAMTGNYEARHCTITGDFDTVYGALARNESGGSFAGVCDLYDNLIVDLSGSANSTGIFLPNSTNDQITNMDNNGWFGIETIYSGVNSATKTAGVTSGYGGSDVTGDPQFVDNTRNLATWDAANGSGTGTVDAGVAYLLGINGYDSATRSQIPSNAIAETPTDLITWVRDGFAPQNAIYNNTASDSTDIGAIAYSAAGGTFKPYYASNNNLIGAL